MISLCHVNPRVRGIRVSPQSGLQHLSEHITREIAQGVQKPFKAVTDVSLGDPHKAGLKPNSFVRQVLAVCVYPQLLKDKDLPLDVRERAQRLLEVCEGGSVGAYADSTGIPHVKQNIAEFITRRDAGVPSYAKDIFIAAGFQKALMVVMKVLASGEGEPQTGMLTPLPFPRTLPQLLDETGVMLVPYQLMEDRGWALDLDELHRALKTARGRCNPRAIYISNPGNPTGHVQDRKSIEEVIQFAADEGLLLLVDEMYQGSVHGQGRDFISYKKVLFEMDKEHSETVELVSFHSLSSSCIGECGLRAGYMELVNIDSRVMHVVNNLLCGAISTPVTGQVALDVMVNPPQPGDASYDTYTQEILFTRTTLAQNAQRVQKFLNDLPGMSCQPVMAGIYLYPRLHLPSHIIEQAKIQELEPDVLYCQRLLIEEGVFVGAGCDNGETTGKHHLRICVLVPPDTLEEVLARLGSFHRRLLSGSSSTLQRTQGAQQPSRKVIDVSSGDPHRAGMAPVSFVRQVLAVCMYPKLLEEESLPVDVRQRAQKLLGACGAGGIGSYSLTSRGLPEVLKSIAEFITRRDGVNSHPDNIIISTGSQLSLSVDLRKDFKDELTSLRHELNQKLTQIETMLQDHGQAITEAEERISDMETSSAVTKETLLSLLKEQRRLREKVTDLESRSRRNNIRVYGVPEDSEGDSMIKFIENLMTTELGLPDGMSLQIQRAHRALTQKPGPDTTPRSIVINFQQFDVKETVLKLAWKKKIHLNNKQIFFDHDYAYEVMVKRRAYGGIKKALKEKGIRFQTPLTRIRIRWSTGPRTYEDAPQAARELRARGIQVDAVREDPGPDLEKSILKAFPWQQAANGGKQMEMRGVLKLMASGEGEPQTGVLTPVPCPNTLLWLLDATGVTAVPYRLMEDRGWALDLDELHRALETARGRCRPRAIYISNPGNPTGHVQDRKSIEEVIRFAATEGLVLLAEEVYQDSVFGQDKEFLSYKRVLFEMGQKYSETVELISFNSISSACIGECGLRGGYMEAINFDPEVNKYLMNIQATCSPPIIPQLVLEVMVNPPSPGDPSYETYTQEILRTQTTLSQNAQRACEFLNDLPGVTCQPAVAGIFLYPRLHLQHQMIEEAKTSGVEADVLYCQRLLEEEGVCLGAGCENGQEDQNYHIRLCVLAPPATLEEILARLRSFHLRLRDRFP
ncbi:uncharacterized protein ABDE67_003935 [Symphorus nematophorus]